MQSAPCPPAAPVAPYPAMTGLILPAHIHTERALECARKEFNAVVLEEAKRLERVRRHPLQQAVRELDSELHLVYWDSQRLDLPLHRHYWYVVRDNGDAPASFLAVHADGQPCEPNSRLLDTLRQSNLHNRAVFERNLRAQRDEELAIQRDEDRADAERREHLRELVNASMRAQVSMSRDAPWTQNQSGRKPGKGGDPA